MQSIPNEQQQETDFWAAPNRTATLKGEPQILKCIHNLFNINT